MKTKIGNITLQFPKKILSQDYVPKNEEEEILLKWLIKLLNENKITLTTETNLDTKKLLEKKRKKTIERVTKIASFIEKQYYVKQRPISFLEVAYKNNLSINTIRRYLRNIIKDGEIVTISKDELIEKILDNINLSNLGNREEN